MTTAAVDAPVRFRLTPEQVKRFHADGFLGPLTACSPDEMAAYREHIDRQLPQTQSIGGGDPAWHNRHLDDPVVRELSTRPQIVGPMTSVLGDDLLLWRTNFFVKEPGGKEIPWHQDRNYWPIEPEVVISAWVAIDRCTVENSAVQLLPGTHRKLIPHVPASDGMAFKEMADTHGLDFSEKVDMEMEPGQFVLFNERTLHHSEPNRSNLRRMGLAIRVIVPFVRVLKADSPQHHMMLISGEDRMGFNTLTAED